MLTPFFDKKFYQVCSSLLIIYLLSIGIFAQSESGSAAIEGSVKDQNGALIQGATIVVKNIETGLERTVLSNTNGVFAVSVLPVGTYNVTANSTGFQKFEKQIILTVGEATPIEILLSAQGATVDVEVTDTDEIVDTSSSSTGTSITPRSIADLPIRGRNFTEFVQLTPAVVQEPDRKGLVIAGQRSINSNVAIDGADFNDSLQGNQRGGNDAVFFFPQTAIKEFQVVRSGATAEVGRTGAGFVNAVTKSGTNNFHGEGFYFNRNDKLTSADAFGNNGKNNQNLFGGSIGGPIKKDRAFFFLGVEKNYLRIPYFVDFTETPGQVLPSELAALQGEQISTNDPISVFARTDFNLNSNNTLNFQYTYSRLNSENFIAIDEGTVLTDIAATQSVLRRGSSNGIKGSLVSVLTPDVINEFRAQFATDNRSETSNVAGPDIRISGIGRLGGNNSRPRIFNTKRYQATNNLSVSSGIHRIKMGIDLNVNQFEAQRLANQQGTWRFNSLADYINLIPRRFDQAIVLFPNQILAKGEQVEVGLFIQDKINFTKNFTITAGLRYESLDNPNPPNPNPLLPETQVIPDDNKQWQPRLGGSWDVRGNGNTVIRVSAGIFAARTPSVLFLRVFTNNDIVTKDIRIDERSGACRTAVGAAVPTNCFFRGSGAIVTYPNILPNLPSTAASFAFRNGSALTRAFGFDPDFQNPRTFQTSGTLEQKIGDDFALTIGYMHTAAWNLQRRLDRNLFAPTVNAAGFPVFPTNSSGGALRPNPAIGIYSVNESTAHSSYDALSISVRRRFAKRYQFEANYTFAENRDDDSNERNFSRETTLNPFDLKSEEAPSKYDVRHNLNMSALFDLGYGFTLSGIIITRSGFPYTAMITDGEDTNNDGNDANERVTINGKVVGRFSERQPYFFNFDMRLLKSFSFGENKKLAFSAEVFNVTRNSNKSFGVDSLSNFCTTSSIQASASNPLNITCPSGFFPSVNAGVPTAAPSTARFGGPRQLQLGVRFSF